MKNRAFGICIAVLSLHATSFSSMAFASGELKLPLSADRIESFLQGQASPTVEGFLAALPASMKENYVLMHESRSLQRATPLLPRQIMFGSDARFLLAVSGIPEDPRYNELEFAEFEPATGRYHFGVISFPANGTPKVTKDVAFCQNCHGATPHPIWEPYPDWKGAYGDDRGAIEGSLKQDFASFLASAPTSPHYQHLTLRKTNDYSTFLLPTRYYPYPNTDFNHELGSTMALGTVARLKSNPEYRRWAAAAVVADPSLNCYKANDMWYTLSRKITAAYAPIQSKYTPTNRADIKILRIMGVDPMVDLSLEKMAGVPGGGAAWQTGAYKLEEAISFQLLVDTLDRDPTLAKMFASERPTIDSIKNHALLVGEARAEALKTSSSWFLFFDVFDPVGKTPKRRDAVCERLGALSL